MKNKAVLILLITILLTFTNFTMAQNPNEIELTNISLTKSESQILVQIEISQPVNYESFTLFNPNRLVIDLFQVTKFSCDPLIEVNECGIVSIRIGKNQPETTRLVFNFVGEIIPYNIQENEGNISVFFILEKEQEKKLEEPAIKIIEKPLIAIEETKEKESIQELKIKEEFKEDEITRLKILSISLNSGFYFVQDTDFQDVYGKSAILVGSELSFQFPLNEKESLGASLGINNITDTGHTTYTKEKVNLRLLPISLSAFYLREYGRFFPFVIIGIDYFNYKENYPETFAISSISGSSVGFNIGLGTFVKIIDSLSIKAYFKLRSSSTSENEVDINLGGNEFGFGLIYHFKL